MQDKTEALFYVQAPFKVDLPGDMTYQYTWVPMLQAASGCTPGGLPGQRRANGSKAFKGQIPASPGTRQQLDFRFVAGQRPQPNKQGPHPDHDGMGPQADARTTSTSSTGKAPYSEKVPERR